MRLKSQTVLKVSNQQLKCVVWNSGVIESLFRFKEQWFIEQRRHHELIAVWLVITAPKCRVTVEKQIKLQHVDTYK